jgi:hypothetical protein
VIVEYVLGFAFGWTIFQALFMRDMAGGSYLRALRSTFMSELPRPFHPKRDLAAQDAFKKKRLSWCCEEGPPGCRPAQPATARHVRGRSALRSHESDTAMLGADWHAAGGRCPTHP